MDCGLLTKDSKRTFTEQDKQDLYDKFNEKLSRYVHVETGIFGADMKVNILNDGPVTILLESK